MTSTPPQTIKSVTMSRDIESQNSPRADLINVLRGLCMGCADVVPGVSGGTVALILGIYERLVTAISHVDRSLWQHMRRRQWQAAARHLDVRFLIGLGSGIISGVLMMTFVINRLLTNEATRAVTLAAFFGMILASAILVASLIRTVRRMETVTCFLLGATSAMFAYWVSVLPNTGAAADPSYPYVFFCGAIAICAMILPGISGAMILLVLGIYVHLTDIPHNLLGGEQIAEGLTTVVVFAAGCLISLILFSKLLRWLLGHHHAPTMAALCGFMFGALRKLWPFQRDLTPDVEQFKHKTFEAFLPTSIDGQAAAVIAAIVVALALVFTVDYFTRRHKQQVASPKTDQP